MAFFIAIVNLSNCNSKDAFTKNVTQSDAKQPQCDVIDNMRNVCNRSKTLRAVAEWLAYFEQVT